jgi:hypothetical protein
MVKALNKLGMEGTYLNIIKDIYDRLTASIILNGENLRSGTKQRCPLSLRLFNIVRSFRKERKRHTK